MSEEFYKVNRFHIAAIMDLATARGAIRNDYRRLPFICMNRWKELEGTYAHRKIMMLTLIAKRACHTTATRSNFFHNSSRNALQDFQ